MMRKQIVNIITAYRVLFTLFLLLFPVFSLEFYITYLLCGFSDMIDGFVARKTSSASEFGAKFDTVADIFFMIVAWCKLGPAIHIPQWTWMWIALIAIIKIGNIVCGFIYKKKLISLHTIMNKTCGFLLFLLPLTLHFVELEYISLVVCPIATFSAIQEGYYIRTGYVA